MKNSVQQKKNNHNCRRDLCMAAVMLLFIIALAVWQIKKGDDRGTKSPPHLGGVYLSMDMLSKAVLYQQEGSAPMLLKALRRCRMFDEAEAWQTFFADLKKMQEKN